MTNGDNAGVGLGVASGLVMGPSRHLTASFTVLFGGMPATRSDLHDNAELHQCGRGARLVPSQPVVLLLAP